MLLCFGMMVSVAENVRAEEKEPVSTTRMYLGSVVNAGNGDGYSEKNEIDIDDPHYNWKLGEFYVSGFTRAIDEESESPVFLKNVGDKVKLSFLLNQDIAKLNGNDDLSIEQDDDGYDEHFGIPKTDFGKIIYEKREETIERVAKAAKELELVDYLNRSIFALSSGEKQQIAIGSVYALAPKVYIFDEPSANLDYAATKRLAEIMGKLKNAGYTIFVVEHRFYYLRDLIDRVFLIQEGKIEREFTREEFCSLPEETRISYGLRTAYPERDAEHYQEKPRPHSGTHLMEVHNLGFSYKKGPDVFQNVSFEAHAGDVIGILGHNGAGKTTLLSILTGLLKQRHGEVNLDGKKLTPRQRRSLSYLVMQDTDYQLFASSVEEELSLGIKEDCKEKVDATLEALELSEYRERHPASLSGGQKQRVTIGAAIVKDSPVIYFDEPTSGLDYDSMVRVSNLIEQLSNSGVIVFVVSHDFEFIVRTCTEVVQLDDHGAIQNHRLSPEILKTLSEKYFT